MLSVEQTNLTALYICAYTLIQLRFYIQLDTKQVISKMHFPANLLASTEKEKNKKKSGEITTKI